MKKYLLALIVTFFLSPLVLGSNIVKAEEAHVENEEKDEIQILEEGHPNEKEVTDKEEAEDLEDLEDLEDIGDTEGEESENVDSNEEEAINESNEESLEGTEDPDNEDNLKEESSESDIEQEEVQKSQIQKNAKVNRYDVGDSGSHVVELKRKLTRLGFGKFPNNPSEDYGTVTSNVVKEFQAYYGLPKTGIADEVTISKINEVLNPPYKEGDRGQAIVQLKKNLSSLGFGKFPNNPSIFYGSVTAKVVRDYQKMYGLNQTGVADQKTLETIEATINSSYQSGSSGEHVRKLKQDLTNLGFGNFPNNPSTAYGSVTSKVVKEFQAYYNLPETGIADEVTISKINEVLNPPYKNGDRGKAIVQLKKNLTSLGFGNFPNNPSIFYGSVTAKVVRDYQKMYELNITGVADRKTLETIEATINSPYQSGKSGENIRKLKQDLTSLGFGNFPKNPSTAYGSVTSKVVREFQAYYNLPETGIADKLTLAKIDKVKNPPYTIGDRGLAIVKLKEDLTKLGYGNFPTNPSIFYGKVTEKVLKEFQSFSGIKADGVAGEQTLKQLSDALSNSLENGSNGAKVVELKNNLSYLGFGNFPTNPSSAYGPVTERVVKSFQSYYGLSQTGQADAVTIQKINETLNTPYQSGKSGDHVVKLKKDLSNLGYGNFPTNPSRVFGSVTKKVVEEYQKSNNLVINGIADEVTLTKIANQLKNNPKITTTYTDYKLTLGAALDIQMGQPLIITDKYRNDPAYVNTKYLKIVGSGKITGSTVHIRTSASTNSDIAFSWTANTPITITGSTTGTSVSGSTLWYEITHNGKKYYVHSSLATGSQAEATEVVNVYAGQGTSHHIFGQLKKGEKVTIKNPGTTWSEITFGTWRNATRADMQAYLDPSKNDKFQHLRLDSSVSVAASELNKVLTGKGVLAGQGQAFIDGAKKHGINEAYLISHAFLETGHGNSTLANGVEVGKDKNGNLVLVTASNRGSLTAIKKTYNMFGIGAADKCPLSCGAITAYENGWFTPKAAIEGGAAWIGNGYIFNEHKQNTLYKMKWNPRMSEGYAWKQYATDIAWAVKQTVQIKAIYDQLKNPSYHYDIPTYF